MAKQNFTAWAAGFIDGEGCFSIGRPTPSQASPKLSVAQIVKRPLDMLQAEFGGSIREKTPHTTSRRLAWEWTITGQPMCEAIERIYPFLVVKRKQASLIWQVATVRDALRGTAGCQGWAVKNPNILKFYDGAYARSRGLNARGEYLNARAQA